MHILPKGHDGAHINIILAPMGAGNGIVYTMNTVATDSRIGFPPRIPEYATSELRVAV